MPPVLLLETRTIGDIVSLGETLVVNFIALVVLFLAVLSARKDRKNGIAEDKERDEKEL
jgi:hypothetical protein